MSAPPNREASRDAPAAGWTLAMVGDGRAARSLGVALQAVGLRLAWRWSRGDPPRAPAPGEAPAQGRLELQPAADVVLLAVSDRAIEEVTAALARRPSAPREVWLHLSGSRPGEVARVGPDVPRAAGAFHPLQSLDGTAAAAARLRGAVAGLDGDPAAVEAGAALARQLGMRPLRLEAATKARYHAAAVMAAGHVAALFAQACRTLASCGLSADEARAALHPLLTGAAENLGHGAPGEVQTGPVPRGDVDTVTRHLAALDAADDPRTARAYRVLAAEALALAQERLDPDDARALSRVLDP